MTYFPVQSPYNMFSDTAGDPLESGYIYIGEANQNPITNPVTIYWDDSGLYPAAQPIRTIGGFPDRNGSASNIYVDISAESDFSILIKDKYGDVVFNTMNYLALFFGGTTSSVDVISDLRAINSGIYPIYVRGHSAIGDDGYGFFEWIDGALAGTYTDDDGIIIVPTGGDGSGAWVRQFDGDINVKWFGATGDGSTSDQNAINKAIGYINGLAGTERIGLCIPQGTYIITGGDNISTGVSTFEGTELITRSNVTINMHSAELKVDSSYFYRRTQIGGGDQDNFSRGLGLSGENIIVNGGIINGNLRNRTIYRGPDVDGYGGEEYGVNILASGCRINNTIVKEWGTDCLKISKGDLIVTNSEFIAGRRLACAITATEDVVISNEIIFRGCIFAQGGAYADDEYNRPAGGLDIEANSSLYDCVVTCDSCKFIDNRKYAVQISQSGHDCVFTNCDFYGDESDWTTSLSLTLETTFQAFNLQPSNFGGHKFIGNRFHKDQYIQTVYGNSTDDPCDVVGNYFEESTRMITFRTSTDYPSGWRVTNNFAKASDIPGTFLGDDHYVYANQLIDPLEESIDGNLAIDEVLAIDITTILPCENVTYEIWAKLNNGSGSYSASGHYIMSFLSGAIDASLIISETASSGRSVVLSGSTLTFTSTGVTSAYGVIIKYIGVGNYGT